MVSDEKKRERLENLASLRRKKETELTQLEEKKKKELEEFEQKKKEEIEEAEEILKAELEGLSKEEEQEILKKLREQNKERAEQSLEEQIIQEKVSKQAIEELNTQYGQPIEEILSSPNAINQRSSLYNDLKETLERARQGQYISQEERAKFYKVQDEFSGQEAREDKFGYVNRSRQVIEELEQTLHSKSMYKRSDDHV